MEGEGAEGGGGGRKGGGGWPGVEEAAVVVEEEEWEEDEEEHGRGGGAVKACRVEVFPFSPTVAWLAWPRFRLRTSFSSLS